MLKPTILFVVSLVLAAGSILVFGDTLRLLAEWRVDVVDAVYVLHAGLLAGVIFAYRAKEARDPWPLSIIEPRP